jgi:lactoylglutathione lyase
LAESQPLLRKIDCVMVRVADLEAVAAFYERVFGLKRKWSDEGQVGLGFAETDAELVLHTDPQIPPSGGVHYLVDDVDAAVRSFGEEGCAVVVEPFDIAVGRCAVIRDPFGAVLAILDLSKGTR